MSLVLEGVGPAMATIGKRVSALNHIYYFYT
jgi:hypothetical protein